VFINILLKRKKLFKKGASAEGKADVLLMGNIKLVLLVF
jgi:hypothetical protein